VFGKGASKRESMEAHQAALLAAAIAFDLVPDGSNMTRRDPSSEEGWGRFSARLDEDDRTPEACRALDGEQVYLQVYVLECALMSVRTADVGLSRVLLDAWDYYLRTLPVAHGIAFDYETWQARRETYDHAWHEALARIASDPKLSPDPFWHLAVFMLEKLCGLNPYCVASFHIEFTACGYATAFGRKAQAWIIDKE
jgi:hypothetical protein